MITVVKSGNTGNNDKRTLLNGKSTDDKPTANITNGSMFVEIDTGDIYLFDEEGKVWNKI